MICMSQERSYEQRQGKYLISYSQLLQRLPEGIRRHLENTEGELRRGTGRYLVPNEYARVAEEKKGGTQ